LKQITLRHKGGAAKESICKGKGHSTRGEEWRAGGKGISQKKEEVVSRECGREI